MLAVVFLAVWYLATGLLVAGGFVICAEYRWVSRLDYEWRVEHRSWDEYVPPLMLEPQLVDVRF
ncbi:hypothetical protein [Kineosporia succinea]|uniref:Uncharacterized protein n=1 Tax=Kineosporia succinea TaxID=84632 RepID=A0ABT9P3K8_9ACTN|nr:hypothetical protein [Kineosporia succinea]MDP9826785.1 hypothetical protein [Kineosporia succinea]